MSVESVLIPGQIHCATQEAFPLTVSQTGRTIAGATAFAERARRREALEPVEIYVNPLSNYPSMAPAPGYHPPCRHGMHGTGHNGDHSRPGFPGNNGMSNLNMQWHVSQRGPSEFHFYDYNTQQSLVINGDRGFVLLDGRGQCGSNGGDASVADSANTAGNGGQGAHGASGNIHHLDGGRGGNGGNGGDSSYGGNGGYSGNASAIYVSVPRPCLPALALMEFNVAAVGPTAPGSNSRPGKGGEGGAGGMGFSHTEHKPDGKTVTRRGKNGRRGHRGRDGRQCRVHGMPGPMGLEGSVTYGVIENDGRVTYANTLFQANTVGYEIVDENDDGVISPCSVAQLRNLRIENMGGLPLDYAFADVQVNYPATVESKYEAVPSLAPGANAVLPSQWDIFIPPMPEPGPAPYVAHYTVNPRVTMLSRTLLESLVSAPLTVQFPVRIEKEIRCSGFMGPNEATVMEIDLNNISRKLYGNSNGSLGSVSLRLRVDPMLDIVDLPSSNPGFHYTIEADGKSAMCELPTLNPHSLSTVKFAVKCRSESSSRLFTNMPCMVDLVLNDQCIEYRRHEIRIVPVFLNMQTDVMLVTSPEVTREEFVGYSYLLQALSLSVNIYDLERYNGFQPNWVGMCRTIVYLSQSNNSQSLLQFLSFSDLYTHLNTAYSADSNHTAIPQTGLLVIGKHNTDAMSLLYDLNKPLYGLRESVMGHGVLPMLDYNPTASLPDLGAGQLPPTFNFPNFDAARNIPAFQVLQSPAVPDKVLQLLSSAGSHQHGEFTVAGCGSLCANLCCCCECTSNDGEVMLRRLHNNITTADSTRQYMFVHSDMVARNDINNKGCFSSETKPLGVYASLYRRDAPIVWLESDARLSSDRNLPYSFDGKTFTSKAGQPWKQGMFLDIVRGLIALLPVYRRVALLSEPFISSQQFEIEVAGNACVGLDVLVGASLSRSVLIDQKINLTSTQPTYPTVEALHQCLPKVPLGSMLYPVLYSVLGPHVECTKIRSQGESLARVLQANTDSVNSAMARFSNEQLVKIVNYSTWSSSDVMFYPADTDNKTILQQKHDAGQFPYVRSYRAPVYLNAAYAWRYSINAYKNGGLVETRTNVPVPVQEHTFELAPAPASPPAYYTIEEVKLECVPNNVVDNGWLDRQQSVTQTLFTAPPLQAMSSDDKKALPPAYSFPSVDAPPKMQELVLTDDMFESAPPVYEVDSDDDGSNQAV